jgi:long-chain acyl-CoA synthetase
MVKLMGGLNKAGIDLRRVAFKSVLANFGGELRTVICGGAPLKQEVIDTFTGLGITIINGYGITECAPLVAANRNKQTKNGSVGMPVPINEVKINEPDENGEGEILVKGPNVMMGYYNDEEATAAAFDEDGFFRTGDYGRLDEDGWLYITGRLKNLIILSNGKNVYPEEIEAALADIPGIVDIVVYEGISRRGSDHNTIVAEIYPDADYLKKNEIEDKYAYFKKHINDYNKTAVPYKKIGLLKIRDTEFPKNTLRKITRFTLDKTID